jgi:uncharacterized low-complexity protein
MSKSSIKPVVTALGAAFLASAVTPLASASVLNNPFAANELEAGYDLANFGKEQGEGKCGEGKCGGDSGKAAKEGKCGEGKCGEGKAAKEGQCGGNKAAGEGKCGEGKAAKEGKCGEGKCGGNKAAQ